MPAQTTPVPGELLTSADAPSATPAIERTHVHDVYNTVASHWHNTRYKAWPRVAAFAEALPAGSLVADLGCGNCKNMIGHHVVFIGGDIAHELLREARQLEDKTRRGEADPAPTRNPKDMPKKRAPLQRAPALYPTVQRDYATMDCVLPALRPGLCDAAMLIAVLHHLSTVPRRVAAIAAALRTLRPGGRLLIYAWALDQRDGVSRHDFQENVDVFVPFGGKEGGEGAQLRYCHMYVEGELDELCAQAIELVGGGRVVETYKDTGNWCAIVER